MPWNVGTKTISRVWAFVDRFIPGETADRDEFDAAFDDVADSVNDALSYYDGRVAALEAADQWYLGVSPIDPTEALDGGPLVNGMYYVRSPEMSLRIYDAGTFRTARTIGTVTPYTSGFLESANSAEAIAALGLTATATELNTLDGVTATGTALVRAASAAAARTAIGATPAGANMFTAANIAAQLALLGFGQSLGQNGYITIPSAAGGPGFVLNWLLVGPIASGANGTAPWLAAFPNACWQVQVSYVNTGGNAAVGSAFVGQVRDFAANGVTIHNTGPAAAQYFVWAVGN